MRFAAADDVTDAYQWWKNGDHPADNSAPLNNPVLGLSEGEVVRRFRRPDYHGTALHEDCGQAYDAHGWIDSGDEGQIVCPGNWIVTTSDGQYRSVRENMFGLSYQPPDGVVPDVPTDTVGDCRDCEFRKQTHGATDAILSHAESTGHVVDVYDVETEDTEQAEEEADTPTA